MEYPKINSLYKRQFTEVDPVTGKLTYLNKGKDGNPLIIGDYACEEFGAINTWTVTEKVDGTNIRIILDEVEGKDGPVRRVTFGGRTDNAQLPTNLLRYLQATFTKEKLDEIFKASKYVVLFGEGYGPKIQSGGYYRGDVSFVLFDVYCSGWWFKRDSVGETALKLGIDWLRPLNRNKVGEVPHHIWSTQDIVEYIKMQPLSHIARENHIMEGVVARSEPMMMFRKGGQIMFKLKCVDMK